MRDVVCALAMLVLGGTAIAADEGAPIFDGKSLAGWKQLGGAADYKVIDGAIVGSSRPGVPNSFLVTEKDYRGFHPRVRRAPGRGAHQLGRAVPQSEHA